MSPRAAGKPSFSSRTLAYEGATTLHLFTWLKSLCSRLECTSTDINGFLSFFLLLHLLSLLSSAWLSLDLLCPTPVCCSYRMSR